jgi:hypothetical protein
MQVLIVKYKSLQASFNQDKVKWTSGPSRSNKNFAKILNDHKPTFSIVSPLYRSSFDKRITGLDGEALDAIAFLGKKLKVVYYENVKYNIPEDAVV